MFRERAQAIVETPREVTNLLRIFGHLFLTPTVRHRLQQRNQRRRRRNDHSLSNAILNQLRIVLECRAVESLTGKKQQYKLGRRLHCFPVRFATQRRDVSSHEPCMILQFVQADVFVSFLPPAVRHRFQQRDQSRRRRDDHALADAVLDQLRIVFECGTVKRFPRQKQQHKLRRRLHRFPIRLPTQSGNVCSNQSRVIFQARRANFVVSSRDRFVKRVERNFRVDDDRAITRQTHDHVWTNPALFSRKRFLLDKIAILKHAGELNHASQLNLSPTAANVGHTQSLHEISGFTLKLCVRLCQRLNLLTQLGIRARTRFFEFADLTVDLLERLLERLDQIADSALTPFEISFCVLLKRLEVLFREIEKRAVVVSERVRRQCFECIGEFLFGVAQKRELFLAGLSFFFEARLQSRKICKRARVLGS